MTLLVRILRSRSRRRLRGVRTTRAAPARIAWIGASPDVPRRVV